MDQFVIYYDPTDYPGKYVLRRWRISATVAGPPKIEPDPEPMAVVNTLEQVRAAVPIGTVLISRDQNDDPAIVEVWI